MVVKWNPYSKSDQSEMSDYDKEIIREFGHSYVAWQDCRVSINELNFPKNIADVSFDVEVDAEGVYRIDKNRSGEIDGGKSEVRLIQISKALVDIVIEDEDSEYGYIDADFLTEPQTVRVDSKFEEWGNWSDNEINVREFRLNFDFVTKKFSWPEDPDIEWSGFFND